MSNKAAAYFYIIFTSKYVKSPSKQANKFKYFSLLKIIVKFKGDFNGEKGQACLRSLVGLLTSLL